MAAGNEKQEEEMELLRVSHLSADGEEVDLPGSGWGGQNTDKAHIFAEPEPDAGFCAGLGRSVVRESVTPTQFQSKHCGLFQARVQCGVPVLFIVGCFRRGFSVVSLSCSNRLVWVQCGVPVLFKQGGAGSVCGVPVLFKQGGAGSVWCLLSNNHDNRATHLGLSTFSGG